MADGSDREVTQAVQNVNSQWSLFFVDLDELLSEYPYKNFSILFVFYAYFIAIIPILILF